MENEQKEMWERLTAVEQSTKSAHHRLDSLDKLTESVHIIATETKAMREDVNDITERVDEIEKRPNKRYETVVGAILTALVGGLIGYFVKMLGFSILNFRRYIKMKDWFKAAGIGAIKTIAQTAIATIGTAAVLGDVNWVMVASAAALAGVLSLLTSVAGLPEVNNEKE